MDLQGLEDIPDFWNIDLDDDDEEVLISEAFDSAKHNGGLYRLERAPTYLCFLGANENIPKVAQCFQSKLPAKQHLERDPRKRPDGKYE